MPVDLSLTRHLITHGLNAETICACVLQDGTRGDVPVFATADGRVLTLDQSGVVAGVQALAPTGGVLAACATTHRLYLGLDDGRVVAFTPVNGFMPLHEGAHAWIDAIAAREDGCVAFSAGKNVFFRDASGALGTLPVPSSVRGLKFFSKGLRLACAHYNGVSLWYPKSDAAPEILSWKGAHLSLTLSHDGRFVITAMQEPELHIWRLGDNQNLRMGGYQGKVRAFSWSHDGKWLATSGAQAAIIWPFGEKAGPHGKSPRECAERSARVSDVAFHPKSLVVAVGYEDGAVMLVRLTDGAELLVRPPNGTLQQEFGQNAAQFHKSVADMRDSVVTMGWNSAGSALVFGTRRGCIGYLPLPV